MRVLSGIQPTGEKHLGNYVGAIRRWVAEQHEMDAFHPIVDLHAITVPQEPEALRELTLDLAALLIACGLDPDICTLFVQSHVPEHPRLAWVLECMTPYGEARRMPQFREKSAKSENFSVGLMTYPVLQAADILLYQADVVPVGEDLRRPRGDLRRGRREDHGSPGAHEPHVDDVQRRSRARARARPTRSDQA